MHASDHTSNSRRSKLAAATLLALVGVLAASSSTAFAARTLEPVEMVTLEIVGDRPGDLAAAAAIVLAHDGAILGEAPDVLLVSLPSSAEDRLTAVVGGAVREPVPVDVRPESHPVANDSPRFGPITGDQVAITNADAWHDAGIDGSGVKVGIIDFFDVTKYWDPQEHGPIPVAGVNARCFDNGTDCTADLFDGVADSGDEHGVAVVETIRDMAPGVEIYLGQATTITDYRALVDWFASKGVTVVNRSLGSRYDGPGDGRGPLDDVAAAAVSQGILWVNSGGNNGLDRYYRQPVRIVNGRVAFGPSGTDTYLAFKGCVALGGIRWANDWDKPAAERTDYDAYLWESPTGNPTAGSIIDSSTYPQRAGAAPLELISNDRCPTAGMSLYLELRWRGGDTSGDIIEILDYGSGMTSFTQATYSAAVSVVDAKSPGVISVGAIDPAASGTIADYSSRGPTNDGRVAPGVVAPSDFANSVLGRFAGTSASAAVVTGGAALLMDASLAANPTSLGDLVRHLTIDRGVAGPDSVYGFGEFRLPNPPPAAGIGDAPSRFVPLDAPTRLLDTRPTSPIGPSDLVGELYRGEILDVPVTGVVGVPAIGVTAVAVNIVTVEPDRPSYIQALPTLNATLGGYSNLNVDSAGQTRANFAIIPVGADGTVSIYSIARGHVVVDVLGWFEQTNGPVDAGRFVELTTSQRLLDTRLDTVTGPLEANEIRRVPMPAGVDSSLIDALVVTVTATAATGAGWVQAYPAGRTDAIGKTSTVNTTARASVANTAIVPIGADGIAVTGYFVASGSAHVIVDAIGYITSSSAPVSAAGRYVPVQPARAFDSRVSGGALLDRQVVVVDASSAPNIAVPDSASGVVWNVAVVGATRPGYLRGWAADQPEPATSSLNWTLAGETRASAAVTAVDAGRARFRMEDGSANLPTPVGHLIVDVFGYFT
jgi:hypothetical protein